MNGLRTAVGFLTRVPVTVTDPVLSRAAPWFPVVGLLIGVAQGAVLVAANQVVPAPVAAALAVGASALITGAFHHDGLADMADAFGGGWNVEQRLAIMKDSRLGTYGTSALIVAFATEISVLAVLAPGDGFRAVVAAHCLSRSIAVATMRLAPLAPDPSRAGDDSGQEPSQTSARGLGAAYAADLSPLGAALAVIFGIAVTAAALAGSWMTVPAVAAAAVAAAAVVALSIRKIGGITGDVLGAVQQLSSLAVLVVLSSAAT